MYVITRSQKRELVNYAKIQGHIERFCTEESQLDGIDVGLLCQRINAGLVTGMTTEQINIHSANVAAEMGPTNYEYLTLAARLLIHNHHQSTLKSFRDKMRLLYLNKDAKGDIVPLLQEKFYKFVEQHEAEIEKRIDYKRDYLLDWFGMNQLLKKYLLRVRVDGKEQIIERPQDMWMRVAIWIHMNAKQGGKRKTLDAVFESYDLMSLKYFTHASPTLFNAGTNSEGALSCFLLETEDSLDGIYDTLKACAKISALSGGIAFPITHWRERGALIHSTGGEASGIIPFLHIFNKSSLAVSQGRRAGSMAVWLEPWHPEILKFLRLKLPRDELQSEGDEIHDRCRNLHYGLWIPDLFMKRVRENGTWSLFSPQTCGQLIETFGSEFEALYSDYEARGLAVQQVRAREVWRAIYQSLVETGYPYILYKDTVNRTSNQANIGVVKSSNLCCEIVEVSKFNSERPQENEYACCTLASINLPMFVEDTPDEAAPGPLNHEFPTRPKFNYEKLEKVVAIVVRNLNNIIDRNKYPNAETERANHRHRPLGIGVQGLADVFFKFKVAWDSPEAIEINRRIAETMYYAALSASTKLAREIWEQLRAQFKKKDVLTLNKKEYTLESLPSIIGAYSTFEGSPLSRGVLNFDFFRDDPAADTFNGLPLLQPYDWDSLRAHVQKFGTRNSLLIAYMPTASTSQILGSTEGIDPLTNNIYVREVNSGNYLVMNKYMFNDLRRLGLWNETLVNYLKLTEGSLQCIDGIPDELKRIYRTVWEVSQRNVIDLSAHRQAFTDQSQSLNLHVRDLTIDKMSSLLFYGFERRLKTGQYYMRTCAAARPQKFTLELTPEEHAAILANKRALLEQEKFFVKTEESCAVCSS